MSLITTKPTLYLVNLTMKDYLRQKSKYLPLIAKWVTTHGGLPRDIIPFSVEFEEKVYGMKKNGDKEGLAGFLAESKVKSRLEKIVAEGRCYPDYSLGLCISVGSTRETRSEWFRQGVSIGVC